jgi:hypothetical protein
MPRRKKIHIAVSELKTRDSLIAELKENPLFEGYDLSTLTVSAVVTSPPPKILKENLEKAIKNLKYQIARRSDLDLIVRKNDLAKAIGVSRPTIDRWCNDGFISSGVKSDSFLNPTNLFDLGVVLRQLEKVKD